MSSELIVNSAHNGGRIALLQDKNLVEFHHEDYQNNFTVGDIYLGVVKRVVPGLNAAFVDIGYEKDAFLHYLDLGPNVRSLMKHTKIVRSNRRPLKGRLNDFRMESEINKLGKMSEVLKGNHQILVQVVKEQITHKGPRVTSKISIPGRYVVLIPNERGVMISKKICLEGAD